VRIFLSRKNVHSMGTEIILGTRRALITMLIGYYRWNMNSLIDIPIEP
jgi:hypothetical protein